MFKKIAAIALLTTGLVTTTSAQNTNTDPNFGTLNLSTGFQPDPTTVGVVSGGTINAANVANGCVGFISNAPDVRVNFAGGSLPLILSVNSSEDTTLVVNAPDGQWYCNDDGGNNMNPSVRFNNPRSGRYEVWVGTYGVNSNYSGTLHVSEVSSQ